MYLLLVKVKERDMRYERLSIYTKLTQLKCGYCSISDFENFGCSKYRQAWLWYGTAKAVVRAVVEEFISIAPIIYIPSIAKVVTSFYSQKHQATPLFLSRML